MWVQDANYAETSGFDFDGMMNWDTAMTWVGDLTFAGYDDWRLPETLPINGINYVWGSENPRGDGATDLGFNNTSVNSERAYMYHVS